MRDRDLAPVALAGAIVCCGAMALIIGLVGAVGSAAIGRFSAADFIAGLGVVAVIGWRLDRRRHRCDRAVDRNDRSDDLESAAP